MITPYGHKALQRLRITPTSARSVTGNAGSTPAKIRRRSRRRISTFYECAGREVVPCAAPKNWQSVSDMTHLWTRGRRRGERARPHVCGPTVAKGSYAIAATSK